LLTGLFFRDHLSAWVVLGPLVVSLG